MNNKTKAIVGDIVRDATYKYYCLGQHGAFGRCVESVYSKILSLFGLSYFPIVSAEKYQEQTGNVSLKTLVVNRVGWEGNVVYDDEAYNPVLKQQPLPDIRLHIYKNVCITGDSDMIVDINRGYIISDACYNIAPEVLFVDGLLYRDKKNVGVLRNRMRHADETIASGIMINGKFSKNYFHSILENLIRLLVVNDSEIPYDVPLLVDDKVRVIPAFSSILKILNAKANRQVIYLSPSKIYNVEQLYYVDHINKLVPHTKVNVNKTGIVAFDKTYLMRLKNNLLEHVSAIQTPKRIFLTRKNTNHRNFNENEVFSILEPLGFVKVAPEEYTFEEQMALFNHAEWIVGGSGAAFTNVIFCSDGCRIVIFRPIRNKHTSPIFPSLAYINHCSMVYFLPTQSDSKTSVHTDYCIDTNAFKKYIRSQI